MKARGRSTGRPAQTAVLAAQAGLRPAALCRSHDAQVEAIEGLDPRAWRRARSLQGGRGGRGPGPRAEGTLPRRLPRSRPQGGPAGGGPRRAPGARRGDRRALGAPGVTHGPKPRALRRGRPDRRRRAGRAGRRGAAAARCRRAGEAGLRGPRRRRGPGARTGFTAGTVERRLGELHGLFADPAVARDRRAPAAGRARSSCCRTSTASWCARTRSCSLGYSDVTLLHLCWARWGSPASTGRWWRGSWPTASRLRPGQPLARAHRGGRAVRRASPDDLMALAAATARGRPARRLPVAPRGGGGHALGPAAAATSRRSCSSRTWTSRPTGSTACCASSGPRARFEGVRGVVFGDMKGCAPGLGEDYTLEEVLLEALAGLDVPIALGLSSGHTAGPNVTLPLGVRAASTAGRGGRLRGARGARSREDPPLGRLRHGDGVARRPAARAGPRGDGLRPGRLPADVHPARGARHPDPLAVRRGERARGRRPGGDRQRALARQPGGGGGARPAAALSPACPRSSPRSSSRPRTSIVVAGTHGKTTTTSLLAFLLDRAGLDPSFLIGGVPMNFGRSYRLGERPALRDRGRRVRQRVLRQAAEVRPLPAGRGDRRQRRVRPRRHLPRPRRGAARLRAAPERGPAQRAAGGRHARARPSSRSCRGPAAGSRPSACTRAPTGGPSDVRTGARRHPLPAAARGAGTWGEFAPGAGRRAQRPQRAGGAGRGGRGGRRARSARAAAPRRASGASSGGWRCGARRRASRSTTTSPTTRRRCARRSQALRRARRGRAPRGRLRAALVHVADAGLPGRASPAPSPAADRVIVAAAHLPGKVPGGPAALRERAGRRRSAREGGDADFIPRVDEIVAEPRRRACGRATGWPSSRTAASAGSTRSCSEALEAVAAQPGPATSARWNRAVVSTVAIESRRIQPDQHLRLLHCVKATLPAARRGRRRYRVTVEGGRR